MDMTVNEINRSLEQFNIRTIHLPNRPDRMRSHLSNHNYLMLKVAFFGAFYPNYYIQAHGGLDMKDVQGQLNGRNPMTTLTLSGFPAKQAKYGVLYANQIKDLFKVPFACL